MNETAELVHPRESLFRPGRMPHIWCPGCGLGTMTNCLVEVLQGRADDLDRVCVVSGIGCTGRVAGYLNLDAFHTTHGRAIPFALGLKTANPELEVIVVSGEGDLAGIGGNHLIHAARRNLDITVICVNNFTYGMTGGQVSPTTHHYARTPTTPYGNTEYPFNLPWLVAAAGAVYVARWTTAHIRQLAKAMKQAIAKRGFSFVEVVAACPTNYGRRNKLGDGRAAMREFRDNSVIKQSPPLEDLSMSLGEQIIAGAFVDKERPTFDDELAALTPKEGAATQ